MRLVVTLTLERNVEEDEDPLKETRLAEIMDDPNCSILVADDGEFPMVSVSAGDDSVSFICNYAHKVALIEADDEKDICRRYDRTIVKDIEFYNVIT